MEYREMCLHVHFHVHTRENRRRTRERNVNIIGNTKEKKNRDYNVNEHTCTYRKLIRNKGKIKEEEEQLKNHTVCVLYKYMYIVPLYI